MSRETKNCIVCLKPAVVYTGHLLAKHGKEITAGFCKEHEDTDCPGYFGRQGCYGIYSKKLGKRKAMNSN